MKREKLERKGRIRNPPKQKIIMENNGREIRCVKLPNMSTYMLARHH